MDYTLGKWLERIDAKLNAVLELQGIDPTTLEPLDQTAQTPEETDVPEDVDTQEPEAQTQEELNAKAEAIKKSLNKQAGAQ